MFFDRLIALLGAITIVGISLSSDVSLNFYVDGSDLITNVLGITYVAMLLLISYNPYKTIKLHLVLPILGLIYWTGRAAAFLNLILNGTNTSLWGAVLERLFIAALLMYWHYWTVQHQYFLSQK